MIMKIKLSTFCTLILFVSVCTSTDIESSDDNIYLQTVIKKAVENQSRPEKAVRAFGSGELGKE